MTATSRVLVLVLVVLLAIGAILLLVLPTLLGSDHPAAQQLKAYLLKQIEHSIGRQVEVGEMRLTVFPRLRLELADVTVRDADPSKIFLSAKRADLVLRLLPLLRSEVVGKRLRIEEPRLHLRRDDQGQWNFLTAAPDGDRPGLPASTPLHLLLVRELAIEQGTLTVTDATQPEHPAVEFMSLDVTIVTSAGRKRADVRVAALMPGSPTAASFSVAGTMVQAPSQVQLAPDEGPGLPSLQFEGTAEATNVQLRKLAYLFAPRATPVTFGGTMNVRGQVRIVPGVVGYDMVLSGLDATVRRRALTGHASLSGLLTDQPTFAVTFSSARVPLEELLEIFPARWMHPALPTVIEERQIQGAVEIVGATVTGVATPEPRLSLTGEFRVEGVHAVIDRRGQGTTIDGVSGTVLLEPGRIRALELSGSYGRMRVSAGKATVSFLDEGAALDLDLKGEMAAADLIAQVDPKKAFRSKNLVDAWNGVRDIRGTTLVAFRMSGPLNAPERIAYERAEFEPREVSFRTPLLPEPVTGLNGRLVISDQGSEFDKLSGWIGQSLVQLQGRILPDEKNAFQEFTITTRAGAMDLLRLLPLGQPAAPSPRGTVGAVIGLSGPLTAPRYKAFLDLNDTGLTLPVLGVKPRGRQASLEIDGGFTGGGAHLVRRAALVFPSGRITARGTARLDHRLRLNATIGFGPIAVTELPDWIRPGGLDRGELEISVEVRGKGSDWKTWQLTGWLAVTNGVLSVTGLPAPVRNLTLRVKLVPNGAELKQFTFAILDSEAHVTGVVRNWQTKPFLALTAESSRFDINLLIPKEKRSPLRDFLEELAATSRVTGTANIKVGRYQRLSFTDLGCRVNITKGVIDIDRISGKMSPGQLDGRVVIRLPKQQPASAEAALRLAGVPFDDVYGLFSGGEPFVTGSVFLTGSLRGHGRDPRGTAQTLNGRTEFRVAKGRIFKDDSRAIWKIISLLNVPALLQGQVNLNEDGLPFEEITASLKIDQGQISTEKVLVNSPVIKISGAGHYDIPHDELDYVVAVSPFGPYSSLLQRVPLFGKLLKGDRQGLTTALFKVTGSIEDPQVEYLPMQSFAQGLGGFAQLAVDLLVNVVTLPKEILAPGDGAPPPSDRMPEVEATPLP